MRKINVLKIFTLIICLVAISLFTFSNVKVRSAETTLEEADIISISDLKQNGKAVGSKIVTKSGQTYEYNSTKTYGSVIFKFTLKNKNWKVDDDGNQYHLAPSWHADGMFWIRPDHVRISYAKANGSDSYSYIVGDPINSGSHDVELCRRAELLNGEYTGNCYYSVKIDGILYCETTIPMALNELNYNKFFITGNSTNTNILIDTNWTGNKITYVSNKEVVDSFDTTDDYLTKPLTDPVVEGKTFVGWFDNLGNEWIFDEMEVTGDMTLTAGFVESGGQTISDEIYFADETYTPVMRFLVSSDTHLGDSSSERYTRLEQEIKVANQYADLSSTYNHLDAALYVGDVSDNGSPIALQAFKSILDANLKSETEAIVSMGNHEYRYYDSVAREVKAFQSIMGEAVDRHVVINGFHFISVSPDTDNGEHFTQSKVEWLEEQLEIAANDNPNIPIFVMQHENVYGTVYGSLAWGMTEFTDVLCKYPQVVDFSGHSHYPLADPRSIWQGTFTALSTGTLHYYEMGINGYKNGGVFPSDKTGGWASNPNGTGSTAEFLIVEIDANNAIRIIVYDLINNCEITRYYLRNVMEDRKLTYSHTERAKVADKPAFLDTTVLNATANENTISLEFNQATGIEIVESYRIELYKGSTLVKTEYALSDYFFNPMPEKIKITIPYLDDETEYNIKVYAVNVWNKECDIPLTATVKTGKTVIYDDVIDEISLSDLHHSSSGKILTTETLNAYLPCYFNPSENNVYGSFILRMQLLYIGESFQICFNEEFANDDLVWFNEGSNNVWFIKDNFHSENPVSKGLHLMEYGRCHITEGPHTGYTKFWVKIDGELIHEYESDRIFTTNGHICLNFNTCYGAGSRYYDIKDEVPTTLTPEFSNGSDYELTELISNWSSVGGALTFDSPNANLEFWLEDVNGAVTDKKTFEGTFILGTDGDYYHYQIKTNSFIKNVGVTGDEIITKICCGTPNWKCANSNVEVYKPEQYDIYDEIGVLDIALLDPSGLFYDVDLEREFPYAGTSPSYSAVLKYYLATEDLTPSAEFRSQLGTLWSYFCTMWIQPGSFDRVFFGFSYSTRPTDKAYFSFQPHTIYEVETGTIRIVEGEWKNWNYTYLKINGEELMSFYVPSTECASKTYGAAFKATGGFVMADMSLGRNIQYIVDDKVYKENLAIEGLKTYEPDAPTKEGYVFCGWYDSPTGGNRIDFSNPFASTAQTTKYYARFSDTSYNVKFYNGTNVHNEQNVGENGQVLKPLEPVKNGDFRYSFINWVIKGTNQVFDFRTPITSDLELEAVFEEYKYRIVYLVDGIEYATRYYLESNPSEIIGGEPSVPTVVGATCRWIYKYERSNKDIYVDSIFDGTETIATSDISLDKFNGETVDIADDLTRFYLSMADTEEQARWIDSFAVAGGHERQDIKFSWSSTLNSSSYLVYFADNDDFAHAFIVKTNKTSLDYVGIFTPGKTYYWKVVDEATGKSSSVDTFTVLNTGVRWISADTVFNMRDMGGWKTTDGKQIKYEAIYRGGQLKLDNSGEKSYMSAYSFKVFNYLGIKTEIELRGDSTHLDNQFNEFERLIRVNGTGYTDFFKMSESVKSNYREVFNALADESNYPFYFHCSWGADRTGGLGFLIGAVLGVPYEQLCEDYELTSFSYSGRRTRYGYSNGTFTNMYNMFMSDYSDGGSLQDAVYNFLVNFVGVKASEIESLRRIMLVDAAGAVETHTVTYKINGEIYQVATVFDGKAINAVAPEFFDKYVCGWTLDGELFDINTPVTCDLVLDGIFDDILYEDYDIVTLRDLGLPEGWTPYDYEPYTYEWSSPNGSRMFEFYYEIPSDKFDDGVHVEIAGRTWDYKSHLWIAGADSQHMFIGGDGIPQASLLHHFELGKTYKIQVGALYPINGAYQGKKIFIFIVDDEILAVLESNADFEANRFISMAGLQGKLYSTPNKFTVTFNGESGLISSQIITRGEYALAIDTPVAPEGKEFVGWYDALGNKWNFDTNKVLKDVALFAKFNDISINASVLDENGIEIYNNYKVKVGIRVSEIEQPMVKANLEFAGWYDGDTLLSDDDVITSDMDLICIFKVIKGENPSDGGNEDIPEPPVVRTFGCKSSLGFVSLMMMFTLSGTILLKKKRS